MLTYRKVNNLDEGMRRDFLLKIKNTEEVTLSGKRTHSGRASGETVLNDSTEGAKEYLFPKLSGKRTENDTYKIMDFIFLF